MRLAEGFRPSADPFIGEPNDPEIELLSVLQRRPPPFHSGQTVNRRFSCDVLQLTLSPPRQKVGATALLILALAEAI
jgi:hypothetical protein